jgi:hypothetical protein
MRFDLSGSSQRMAGMSGGRRGIAGMKHGTGDGTYLNFSPQDKMGITRISEPKNSAELLRGEITDVADFEFGRLARDPRRQ